MYLDDLLVKRKSTKQYIKDLKETFSTLNWYDMCFNPLKCIFGTCSKMFLCFFLTFEGIKVNLDKMKAIMDIPSLRTKKKGERTH